MSDIGNERGHQSSAEGIKVYPASGISVRTWLLFCAAYTLALIMLSGDQVGPVVIVLFATVGWLVFGLAAFNATRGSSKPRK